MFTKKLIKSFSGAAAVGGLLAAGLVAGPATTFTNVACAQYPSSVPTTTDITLSGSGGQYGAPARATVSVDSGVGSPKGGQVRINIVGAGDYTVPIQGENGSTFINIPKNLPAGETYEIRARYLAPGCSQFQDSSDTAFYTVTPARTSTVVTGPNRIRGQRPVARVTVDATTAATPVGLARVKLIRGGTVRDAKTVRLESGSAAVKFAATRGVGRWSFDVTYVSNSNFRNSKDATSFRVTRR
jgi:hypothetical protein